MKRDNLSRSEAIAAIEDCKEEIELAIAVGHYEKSRRYSARKSWVRARLSARYY